MPYPTPGSRNWSAALEAMIGAKLDPTDAYAKQRLDRAGDQRARLGGAGASAAYADASEMTEAWANLTGVNPVAGNAQVSGNKLYSQSAATPGGATKTVTIPVSGRFHFQSLLYWKAGAASPVYFGIDCGTPGHALINNEPYSAAIGISGAGAFNKIIGSSLTSAGVTGSTPITIGAAPTVDSTWQLTIDGDDTWITFLMKNLADTGTMYYHGILRSQLTAAGLTVNNIFFYLVDGRGTAGHAFGPLVGASSLQPTRTKILGSQTIEGAGHRIRTTSLAGNTDAALYALPKSYDPRKPTPVALFCHQSLSGNARSPWSESRLTPVTKALLDAGYLVAACDAGGDKYGNPASVSHYLDLYNHLRDIFNTGPLFLFGASMGTLDVFNILGQRNWPTPAAVAGIGGAYSLQSVLAAGEPFASATRTAYGAAADGSDFAVKTAGSDPGKRAGWEFRGVPVRLYTSTADVTQPSANAVNFAAKVAPYDPESTVVYGSGGHLDASQYQGADLVAFFDRYRA